jgi:peptide/nickel transport system substrate-binding protein
MHRLTNNFTLFALLVLSFVSCHQRGKESGRFFRYNEVSGLTSLDPAFAKSQATMWPAHQLFSTLVEVNDSLQIVPLLAKSWTISEDGKRYRFLLRDDVFFHDDPVFNGKKRKLIAADIAFSFNRIISSQVASPGSWIFNGKVDTLDPFVAINDSVFELRLLRPYQPILGILSMQYCSIMPKEAIDFYGTAIRQHPVGTGPFQFVAWEEGQALILKRNPNYFEKDSAGNSLPYLDGIDVSFYDSKATEFLLFRQKQLDFINDIDPSFKDEVLSKKGELRSRWKKEIELQINPYLNVEYLGILVDTGNSLVANSPLRLKKIRQAINYGFDRSKMILYLRNSIGTPAFSGFVPLGLPSFDAQKVKGYSYNPAKTKQLLTEAGFPEGKGLPTIKLQTIPIYGDMASYIAKQLEESGIPVQVEVVQKSLLLDMAANNKTAFFRAGWIADYPDAENYLSVFYSKNPSPPNYTRYNNPAFDKVFEQAIAEKNDSLRYLLYQKADQMAIDDAPVVPLWYDKVIRMVQPGIQGFKPNALNLLELRKVKFAKKN